MLTGVCWCLLEYSDAYYSIPMLIGVYQCLLKHINAYWSILMLIKVYNTYWSYVIDVSKYLLEASWYLFKYSDRKHPPVVLILILTWTINHISAYFRIIWTQKIYPFLHKRHQKIFVVVVWHKPSVSKLQWINPYK